MGNPPMTAGASPPIEGSAFVATSGNAVTAAGLVAGAIPAQAGGTDNGPIDTAFAKPADTAPPKFDEPTAPVSAAPNEATWLPAADMAVLPKAETPEPIEKSDLNVEVIDIIKPADDIKAKNGVELMLDRSSQSNSA
jgi:hypothetical protein